MKESKMSVLLEKLETKSSNTLEMSGYLAGLSMLTQFPSMFKTAINTSDLDLVDIVNVFLSNSREIRSNPGEHIEGDPKKELTLMFEVETDIEKMFVLSKMKKEAPNSKVAPKSPTIEEPVVKDMKGKLRYELMDPSTIAEINHWILVLMDDEEEEDLEVTLSWGDDEGPKEIEFEQLEDVVKSLMSSKAWIAACIYVMSHRRVTLDDIVECYTLGAKKYTDHGWKNSTPESYLGAAYRHIKDGINGEDSGLQHWAHFCWNMCALRWFEKQGIVPKP